jgi:hypothetical protein|tara:strand:- start:160 stop:429 length:270 start_codon:yes stop_codon:yes gene_type:complete
MNKVEKVIDVINQSRGRICSVRFIKKDGSVRKMVFRKGVRRGVKGKGLSYNPESVGNMVVFEMKNGFRTINCNSVLELKANRKSHKWSK